MIKAKTNSLQYTQFTQIFRTDTNQYSLNDIEEEYEEWKYILTALLGFKVNYEIETFNISNRLSQCLAKTGKKQGRGYLTVNGNFIREHSEPDVFHSVIAHETIHTLVGCFDHKDYFLYAGRRLSDIYSGIKISRLTSDAGYLAWQAKQLSNKQESGEKRYKYKIVCPRCGQIIYRERLSKLVKSPDKFRCGRCYSKFDVYEIMSDGTECKRMFIKL